MTTNFLIHVRWTDQKLAPEFSLHYVWNFTVLSKGTGPFSLRVLGTALWITDRVRVLHEVLGSLQWSTANCCDTQPINASQASKEQTRSSGVRKTIKYRFLQPPVISNSCFTAGRQQKAYCTAVFNFEPAATTRTAVRQPTLHSRHNKFYGIIHCMFMYLHRASWHSSAALTEVFPCFFLNCKANARVKPAKMGHGPHCS
jgi:hypothetical protein